MKILQALFRYKECYALSIGCFTKGISCNAIEVRSACSVVSNLYGFPSCPVLF